MALFREEGVPRGVAYNGDGIAKRFDGYRTLGDYDKRWRYRSLGVPIFALEANCLMQNDGDGYFEDMTFDTDPRRSFFLCARFSVLGFIDFDNDGWLDFARREWDISGDKRENRSTRKQSYAQPVQLFRNQGGCPTKTTLASPRLPPKRD